MVVHGGTEMLRSKGLAPHDEFEVEAAGGRILFKGRDDTYNLRAPNRFLWESLAPGSDHLAMRDYWRGLLALRGSEYGEVFRIAEMPKGHYRWITPEEDTLLGYVVGERVLVLANSGMHEGLFRFDLPTAPGDRWETGRGWTWPASTASSRGSVAGVTRFACLAGRSWCGCRKDEPEVRIQARRSDKGNTPEKRMREKMRILRWTRRAAPASAIAMAALLAAAIGACAQEPVQVASPDGRNVVTVGTSEGGLFYSVERDGRKVILPSRLGFEFRDAPPLRDGLELSGTERSTVDETWEQPWGEVARVRDHHNELRVSVAEMEEPGRRFDVVFRVFDDGLGFRYQFPEQPGLESFAITDELTEFYLADDARAWWILADDVTHRYELLYSSSPMSTLPTVHTPLTMETRDGLSCGDSRGEPRRLRRE